MVNMTGGLDRWHPPPTTRENDVACGGYTPVRADRYHMTISRTEG